MDLILFKAFDFMPMVQLVSGIGAVVKVVDSHLCGWGSIPGESCSFFHSLLKQELITVPRVF